MKPEIADKIKQSITLNDYLNTLLKYYDCENCQPSGFIKSTIVFKLVGMLNGVNVIVTEAVRIKCLNSGNIKEFINIIVQSFNLNGNLSTASKINLVDNTEMLLKLTGLKELENINFKKAETQKPELKKAIETKAPEAETLVQKFSKQFKRKK